MKFLWKDDPYSKLLDKVPFVLLHWCPKILAIPIAEWFLMNRWTFREFLKCLD